MFGPSRATGQWGIENPHQPDPLGAAVHSDFNEDEMPDAANEIFAQLQQAGCLDLTRSDRQGNLIEIQLKLRQTGVQRLIPIISKCSSLKKLSVSRTDFADSDLLSLLSLRDLEMLDLSQTAVSKRGFAELKNFPRLEYLVIDHTSQVDDETLGHIARINSLKELNIEGASVSDDGIAQLGRLKNLESLVLGNSATSSGIAYDEFLHLQHFSYLSAGHAITNEGLKTIGQLTNLTTLFLKGPITDPGFRSLVRMKGLSSLAFRTTGSLSSEAWRTISELSGLQYLDLISNKIDDNVFEVFPKLTHLETLSLMDVPISKSRSDWLRQQLPKCHVGTDFPEEEKEETEDDEMVSLDFLPPFPFEIPLPEELDEWLIREGLAASEDQDTDKSTNASEDPENGK